MKELSHKKLIIRERVKEPRVLRKRNEKKQKKEMCKKEQEVIIWT